MKKKINPIWLTIQKEADGQIWQRFLILIQSSTRCWTKMSGKKIDPIIQKDVFQFVGYLDAPFQRLVAKLYFVQMPYSLLIAQNSGAQRKVTWIWFIFLLCIYYGNTIIPSPQPKTQEYQRWGSRIMIRGGEWGRLLWNAVF